MATSSLILTSDKQLRWGLSNENDGDAFTLA